MCIIYHPVYTLQNIHSTQTYVHTAERLSGVSTPSFRQLPLFSCMICTCLSATNRFYTFVVQLKAYSYKTAASMGFSKTYKRRSFLLLLQYMTCIHLDSFCKDLAAQLKLSLSLKSLVQTLFKTVNCFGSIVE